MKTERRFAEILKTMMSEQPLDTISVSLLSKKCHVNRQTFYYHFHDIYDLLMVVFLNEKIPNINECKNLRSMLACIFDYYTSNRMFIDATLESAGKDLFSEFIFNNCYQCFMRLIQQYSEGKNVTATEKKSIVRFYAYGVSNSVINYFASHKNKNLRDLENLFLFLEDRFLKKGIIKISEAKKK